ncbi:hypothetical protein HMPREF0020_01833, partial [Acinetobacter baumannii 6013113]
CLIANFATVPFSQNFIIKLILKSYQYLEIIHWKLLQGLLIV